jgi:hypothetical protein
MSTTSTEPGAQYGSAPTKGGSVFASPAEALYDVVIYEKATRKIDAAIGERMKSFAGKGTGRNTAELRVQTGKERINEDYGCQMIPTGKYRKGDILP